MTSYNSSLTICEQEGSFAFIFKSSHYPNEVVATRRGSPLLIGVKTAKKLKVDFVDVEFGNAAEGDNGKRLGFLHSNADLISNVL